MEKAILYKKWGGAEELAYEQLPDKQTVSPDSIKLGKGEILVRVHSISINPIDWKILSGSQKMVASGRFPRVFGTDFAGVIQKAGSAAEKDGFTSGVRVMGMVSPLNNGSGRQWLKIRADHCIILPESLSLEEGASLSEAGVSALLVTSFSRKKKAGRVLVFGSTGGVGSLAVQILSSRGWDITAVCRESQQERLKELGCSQFIDRHDWEGAVKAGGKWDAIVDCPGVIIRNRPSRFLNKRGVYSPVYIPDPFIPWQVLRIALWFFTPYSTGLFVGYPSASRMRSLGSLIRNRTIVPLVDSVFKSKEIRSAVSKSQNGGVFGKLIITLD